MIKHTSFVMELQVVSARGPTAVEVEGKSSSFLPGWSITFVDAIYKKLA